MNLHPKPSSVIAPWRIFHWWNSPQQLVVQVESSRLDIKKKKNRLTVLFRVFFRDGNVKKMCAKPPTMDLSLKFLSRLIKPTEEQTETQKMFRFIVSTNSHPTFYQAQRRLTQKTRGRRQVGRTPLCRRI